MSERASRERDLIASHAPAAPRAETAQPKPTPAEQAHDVIVMFSREIGDLRATLDEVREAHAANDPDRWTQARGRIDSILVTARRSLDRARAQSVDATPDALARLAATETELELLRKSSSSLGDAPSGFATVSGETEILVAFDAPLEGGFRLGFEKKEAMLKARFDRLAPAERRVVADRLRRSRPNDPIAAAFSRLSETRRRHLLEHLASASQREAHQCKAHGTAPDASETPPAEAPQATASIEATPDLRPAIAHEPESLDTKLRRILEAGAFHAIESAFADVVADLDGTTRRSLAKRLETYRPGSGDEIAARFARLDRALRQRICTGLRIEAAPDKLPDEIRNELESATGTALNHVNLHSDPQANDVATAHGARAVAIGGDIYMGEGQLDTTSREGRELIAHEVAHVVQAQVKPAPTSAAAKRASGDDRESAAEVDADLFAARFRAEGAAASWRPSVGIDGSSAMRAPAAKPAPRIEDRYKTPQPASTYFAVHERKFLDAIRARIASLHLPAPNARLAWTGGAARLATAFDAALFTASGGTFNLYEKIPRLLYPSDPWRVIDQHRDLDEGRPGESVDGKPAKGTIEWNPVVGLAFAVEVEAQLRESLPRMGLRFVAVAEQQAHVDVRPEALIASHPFDHVVARLLCDSTIAHYVADKHSKQRRDTDARTAFKHGLRLAILEWQGQHDPKLWNWVKVVEPVDPTNEELAMAVFERGDGVNHTEYAYGITGAAPYFCIPPRWARELPGAKEHAPNAATDDLESQSALALADSKLGDDAAVAQAARTTDPRHQRKPDLAQLAHVLDQSEKQLRVVGEWLGPWKLSHLVGPSLRWVIKHRDHLDDTPDATLRKWAPAIEGQRKTLLEATGELLEVAEAGARFKNTPEASEARPFREVLQAFGIAMGESHLVESAAAQMATARQRKSMLPLELLERSLRETHSAKQDMVAHKPAPDAVDRVDLSAGAEASQQGLERAAVEMRAKAVAGGKFDLNSVETIAMAASEDGLRYRTRSLGEKAGVLLDMVEHGDEGMKRKLANTFDRAAIGRIKQKLLDLRSEGYRIRFEMDQRITDETSKLGKDPAVVGNTQLYLARLMDARRGSVTKAQSELADLSTKMNLAAFFDEVIQKVADMQWRALWVDLALMIGISIAGGVAGAVVGGAVRGAMLADAAVNTMSFARIAQAARTAGLVANVVTDAAVTSVGQTIAFGDRTDLAFAENLISNVAIISALRPLHAATSRWLDLEKGASLWSRAGRLGAKTAIVSTEMITSAAIGYVATRLVKGKPPPSDDVMAAWALQGASMAIGRFISGRLTNLQARLQGGAEELVHLRGRARHQKQLARQVEESGKAEQALKLLDEHQRLLADEHALLNDDAKLARLGLDAQQIKTMRAGNDAALADTHSQTFSTMRLQFHGLEPLAENARVWSGTADHIQAALADANAAAKILHADPKAGRWRAYIAGQEILFVETAALRPTTRRPLEGPPPEVDASYHRAHAQAEAVRHLDEGTATEAHRKFAADEIERQVPDVALTIAVEKGAKTVISVVTPGGGAVGVKALNDESVGRALADELIRERNAVFEQVFAQHHLQVVHESYKTVTVVSSKPPSEIGKDLRDAIGEIDEAMKTKLTAILNKGETQWRAKLAQSSPGSDDFKAAQKRVESIHKLKNDPTIKFAFQLGAAEIKGGKTATYEQILSAEMNASKAAIAARDTSAVRGGGIEIGDSRGMIYSEQEFVKFARATIAMRDRFQHEKRTLPWGGEDRPVVDANGNIDREIAWAVRKNKLANLNDHQKAALAELKVLIDRINTLDYMTRYTSDSPNAGADVKHAVELVTKLRDPNAEIAPGIGKDVATTLEGDVARSGTASEAAFLNRAAKTKDRIVLNADIKDLGLDVAEGNLRAMKRIDQGADIDTVSRGASDEIVELKREIVMETKRFFENELLPVARQRAIEQKRQDLLPSLDGEDKPLILFGGDEITLSVPSAFEVLRLVPTIVNFLQTKANSRVAVTRTGNVHGARGHERAMNAAETAHKILKSYEEIGRDLDLRSRRWVPSKRAHAREIVTFLEGLYTIEEHGNTIIRHVGGKQQESQLHHHLEAAKALLKGTH